jgi:DNA transformation protein
MTPHNEFVEFVLEELVPVGRARTRAMFGGYGIYLDNTIFAIIVDDRLYFKADGATCHAFTEHGLNPFTYVARGKTITMQYYEASPEVFEEPESMQNWARLALGAALRTKKGKVSPARRSIRRR